MEPSVPNPELPPVLAEISSREPEASGDDIAKTYDAFTKVLSEPDPTKELESETNRNMSWGDTIAEAAGPAVSNGLEDFIQAGSTPIANALGGNNAYRSTPREHTAIGSVSHFIAQQVPALLPVNKALQAGRLAWAGAETLGSLWAGGKAAGFLTGILGEGISASVAFGGHQEKLADALAPHAKGSFLEPVFDALKTDPNGSEAMNRFRNAIDNMGVSTAFSSLLHGLGIIGRKVLSREAGATAADVAKNLTNDIAEFRKAHPELSSQLDKAIKDSPNLTEEEAFTALIKTNAAIASKGGPKQEELAKLLSFVGGENEAKANHVEKTLFAQAANPELEAQAAEKVDAEFLDYYAANGRRMEAEAKAAGFIQPSSGETLIPPDVDGEAFKGFLETEKFLKAQTATRDAEKAKAVFKVSPEDYADEKAALAGPPVEPDGPDHLAQVLPVTGKVREATKGIGLNPEDKSDIMAFHSARVTMAMSEGKITTPKQLVSAMKADGAALVAKSEEDLRYKTFLKKFTPAQATDYIERAKVYNGGRLFQTASDGSVKGYTDVIDGRAIIGLYKGSDVSTIVHELTHAYDRLGVAPEFMGQMRTALGFSADDTSREASEAIATAFEKFAFHGELDQEWAGSGLKKLSEFMQAVYKDVDKTPMGLEMSEPVRMAFRGMGGLEAIGNNLGVRPELQALKTSIADTDYADETARKAIFDKVTDTHLNLATINGSDAQTVMKQIQDEFDHVLLSDRGGVESHAGAVNSALGMMAEMGGNVDTLAGIAHGAHSIREINGKFVFWKGLTESWANQVVKTRKALKVNPDDVGLQKQFEVAFDSVVRMRMLMADITTESARLLGKHRIKVPTMELDKDLIGIGYKELMVADKQSGGRLLDQVDALIGTTEGDPLRRVKTLTEIPRIVADRNKTFMNLARSIYTSSILSVPHTMAGLQVLGGVVQTVTKPAQYIAGGMVSLDAESVRFGLDLYKNLFHMTRDFVTLSGQAPEAMDAVWRTFKQGSSVSEHDAISHMVPSDVYSSLQGATKTIVDGAFNVLTGAPRIMGTLDEATRQFYGRAFLRTRGMDEAYKQGLKHGMPEFDQTVKKFVDAGFGPNGTILDPMTIRELQDLTFKRPLRDSSNQLLKALDGFSKAPGSWLFQPFMRTPVNIGREAAMSIPGIGFVSGAMREGFSSSNPRIAAAYRGRQVLGFATLGFFGGLAYSGAITGSGPDRNTEAGKQWYNAGHRPYSVIFKNGDGSVTSVGYMQIEPFSTVAALCVNAVESLDQSNVPDEKKTDAAWAVAAGLTKTWSDKRYLTGISTLIKVLNGDAAAAKQSFAQIASGMVPLSGLQSTAADLEGDGEFKHSQGLLEQIQNRTLFKTTLEPKRDFFGDPVKSSLWNTVSPLPTSTTKGDKVVDELVDLGGRVKNGFSDKLRGIDLTEYRSGSGQSAYDRRMELRQTTELGGHTLKDAMGRVIASKSYQKINGTIPEGKVERADLLQKVVEQYNAKVQDTLLREFPDLKTAFIAADPNAKKQLDRKTAYQQIAAIPK